MIRPRRKFLSERGKWLLFFVLPVCGTFWGLVFLILRRFV